MTCIHKWQFGRIEDFKITGCFGQRAVYFCERCGVKKYLELKEASHKN